MITIDGKDYRTKEIGDEIQFEGNFGYVIRNGKKEFFYNDKLEEYFNNGKVFTYKGYYFLTCSYLNKLRNKISDLEKRSKSFDNAFPDEDFV